MNGIQDIVGAFLNYLTARDLQNLLALFAENPDWYIPGDEQKAPWLGRRSSRQEISEFFRLLWQHTEPLSATVDALYFNGDSAVIAGEFATRMLPTGKVVNSPFFIQMTVQDNKIATYRLLEDSYAVSIAMTTSAQ